MTSLRPPLESILIANRGEIAIRIARTARALGIRTVAVYSEADRGAPHSRACDRAEEIGPGPARDSYLDAEALLRVARQHEVAAVHPGYGFLSESPDFAEQVLRAGFVWVGPRPDLMRLLGDKAACKQLYASAGVPVSSGGSVASVEEAVERADSAGYPVMVKAANGGGGIGMEVVNLPAELARAYTSVRSRAEKLFGGPDVLVERFVPAARHVEVQILGLPDGQIASLGIRDCSVQRRRQKILEESPADLDDDVSGQIVRWAVDGLRGTGYLGAGTAEFLVGDDEVVFLEFNPRLQVEHTVTEALTGLDLVAEQLRIAAGAAPSAEVSSVTATGHAIEARINAEHPVTLLPSAGEISVWQPPSGEGIRVDSGYAEGVRVPIHYDSLLAKVIAWASTREACRARLHAALSRFEIAGVDTNIPLLLRVLDDTAVGEGRYDTGVVDRLLAASRSVQE